jgi:hypothetical protein
MSGQLNSCTQFPYMMLDRPDHEDWRLDGWTLYARLSLWKMSVFWPHSVFGQNHLYVRMLQTWIPLFRVKSEEFQSSLSAVRTMCHPVWTPIFLLLNPSGRCVIPSGRQKFQHLPSGWRASSVRTLHCIEKLLYQLALSRRFSSTSGRLSVLERFTDSFQVPRKGRSINRPDDVVYHPDAYLRKARIVVKNEPSGHLTAVIRTLVHRIW